MLPVFTGVGGNQMFHHGLARHPAATILGRCLWTLFLTSALLASAPPAAAQTVSETIQRVVRLEDLPAGYRQTGQVRAREFDILAMSDAKIDFARQTTYTSFVQVFLQQYRDTAAARRDFDGSLRDLWGRSPDVVTRDAGIGAGSIHLADYETFARTRREIVSQHIHVVWQRWVFAVYILRYNDFLNRQYSDADASRIIRQIAEAIVSRLGGGEAPAEGPDCGKAGALTRYLEALRSHQRSIAAFDTQFQSWLDAPPSDPRTLIDGGQRALAAATAFQSTLREFQRAETRRGLIEELDLLVDTPILLNQVVVKYQKLVNVPITPLDPNGARSSREDAARSVLDLARAHYASRLESEGLRDILTADSWNEAVDKAAFHAQRKLDELLDRETEKLLGIGFHDAQSAQRALRLQMRREVRRQVAKLLVKVTSNEIVIEIVAGPIIRWLERDLWPRLRESLRQKGNLPERVTQSLQTMESARRELNQLGCDARLRDVRRRMDAATGVILATRYLEKDIRDANAAPELARLSDGMNNLGRTLFLTRKRFLLEKDDYEDDLVFVDQLVGQMVDILRRSIPPDPGAGQRLRQEVGEGVIDLGQAARILQGVEQALAPDIPALSARVAGVRLFEAGSEAPEPARRAYGTSWPQSSARAVWWELALAYPDPGRRIDFRIDGVFSAADGRVLVRTWLDTFIMSGWKGSHHIQGRGGAAPGTWAPGTYRVELFVSGRSIGGAVFEITR